MNKKTLFKTMVTSVINSPISHPPSDLKYDEAKNYSHCKALLFDQQFRKYLTIKIMDLGSCNLKKIRTF